MSLINVTTCNTWQMSSYRSEISPHTAVRTTVTQTRTRTNFRESPGSGWTTCGCLRLETLDGFNKCSLLERRERKFCPASAEQTKCCRRCSCNNCCNNCCKSVPGHRPTACSTRSLPVPVPLTLTERQTVDKTVAQIRALNKNWGTKESGGKYAV